MLSLMLFVMRTDVDCFSSIQSNTYFLILICFLKNLWIGASMFLLCACLLQSPWSLIQQKSAHTEPDSAGGFFLLKGSFSSCMRNEPCSQRLDAINCFLWWFEGFFKEPLESMLICMSNSFIKEGLGSLRLSVVLLSTFPTWATDFYISHIVLQYGKITHQNKQNFIL